MIAVSALLTSLVMNVAVVCGYPGGSSSSVLVPGIIASPLSGHTGMNLKSSSQSLSDLHRGFSAKNFTTSSIRSKRAGDHHITECIHMTSEEGDFYHKANTADGQACGVYIFSEPNQNIEIRFNFLDLPCENGGLVAVIDGWELNGEYFPSLHDHPRPLRSRFNEFCGQRKVKKIFGSSQNVALIQYRMPAIGTSFSFNVRFVRNPNPCNVLFQTDEIYTLRNYGGKINCSVSSLFPAAVKVASLNVGVTPSNGRGVEIETGTIHKCQKRGLDDYVQIGGSPGLDNTQLQLADSLCGLNSRAVKHTNIIGCDTTTVRLVSSGAYDNSVTVYLRQISDDDINGFMDVVCLTDDMLEA